MVWWIQINKSHNKTKQWLFFKSVPDKIFQTVNIIFDCHNPNTSGYVYHFLGNVGVNIFNVDLTKHDMEFFDIVKYAFDSCEKIQPTYLDSYTKPIGLSVTMSVKEPLEIDDRVDIIILKDITKTEELLEFRKRNKRFSSMPILSWPLNYRIEGLRELIKRSYGIILDKCYFTNDLGDFLNVLKIAKEEFKPVFHVQSDMVQDYHNNESQAQSRRILTHAHNLVHYGLDGVIIEESVGQSAIDLTQTFVRATALAQREVHAKKEFYKGSFEAKIPALPPMSTAFGASIAALNSKTKAILVLTMSGTSARLLSKTTPPCHIIAVTVHERTARCMHLYRKVIPLFYNKTREVNWHSESSARVVFGTRFGLEIGLFDFTDRIVVLAPLEEGIGYCNSFKIVKVSDVLSFGTCHNLDCVDL